MMNQNIDIQKSMTHAESSIKMEGLKVSKLGKELCIKVINKEITFEEYLKRITAKAKAES